MCRVSAPVRHVETRAARGQLAPRGFAGGVRGATVAVKWGWGGEGWNRDGTDYTPSPSINRLP